MFIILLKFSKNKDKAPEFMEKHKEWLSRGFSQEKFVLAGSIAPGMGGAIIAKGQSAEEISRFVNEDPFVIEDIVRAEVLEVNPSRYIETLAFLSKSSA